MSDTGSVNALSSGAIVGIVIGIVGPTFLVIGLLHYLSKRRRPADNETILCGRLAPDMMPITQRTSVPEITYDERMEEAVDSFGGISRTVSR